MLGALEVTLLSAIGLSIIMLGVLATLWQSRMPGVREWFWANLIGMAACVLYWVGWGPKPFLVLELANALYGTTGILIVLGYRRFFGKPLLLRVQVALLVLVVAVLTYFHYVRDLVAVRVLTFSLFEAVLAFIVLRATQGIRESDASRYPIAFARLLALFAVGLMLLRAAIQLPEIVSGAPGASHYTTGPGVLFLSLGLLLWPALTLAASSIVTTRLICLAHEEAKTDFLTKAWSRRALLEFSERELARTDRSGHPLSLLILDIDDFKRINDAFGHPVGDQVLAELARLVTGSIREIDYFCRLGGEEFAVLMPDTAAEAALEAAERLRVLLSAPRRGSIHYTVSIGVGVHATGEGWQALYKAADDALVLAKRAGKNRVVLWSDALAREAAPSLTGSVPLAPAG